MEDLAAFAVVSNLRDRIIEFGEGRLSWDKLEKLLIFCGLPCPNGELYEWTDVDDELRRPELPSVHVYVFVQETGGVPMCKVGISNNPARRRHDLSDRPTKVWVHGITQKYRRGEALRIERSAHAILSECAIGHEWFACPPDLAWRAVVAVGGDVEDVI